jgi:sortase A
MSLSALTVLLRFSFSYIASGMKPLFWLDRSLLIVGAVCLAAYVGIRVDGSLHSRADLRAFRAHARGDRTELGKNQLSSGSAIDFSLWSPKRIEDYQHALLVDSRLPVAVLRIPKIGLEVPVLEGTDEVSLNRGVGRIVGTARPLESGNIGIAGHRDGFFRGLKEITTGDVVELESNGARASYAVDEIEIVEPKDGGVLRPRSKPAVTLVTCYPFYFVGSAPSRFIVHASLTQVIQGNTAQVASDHTTAKNENN